MKLLRYSILAACLVLGLAANASATIGWAGNVWPLNGANVVPTGSVNVYAQVWKGGVTDSPGQGAGIAAELQYATNLGAWPSVPMAYNTDIGNNDEYTGQIPQVALVGASWVDVTVVFTDQTDMTTFQVATVRYNVVNVLPNNVSVTFTLCMSGTPTTGAPCVIGSASEIGTWGTGVSMTNISGELWRVTVTFLAGGNPSFEYKYKKDACVDWESASNRPVTLPTDGTTSVNLPPDSYNNAPIGCGLGQVLEHDKIVCIQVCMEGVQAPPVCVTGSVAQLTNWGSGAPMSLVGPDLFQACVIFAAGTPIPLNVEYKFRKDGCDTWESVGNRTLTIDNSSPNSQTVTSSWDNGPSQCVPVGVAPTNWGTMKRLYR